MEKNQFNVLLAQLKKMEGKLDLLVKFAKIVTPSTRVTGEEKKILDLCNQKNTVADIVAKTGKTVNNVRVTLTHLRNKGLIVAEKIKKRHVYRRL